MAQQNAWKLLSLPFNNEVNNALQQHHHAAQFIALAGRYLIPKKPDGSNINMQYIPEKEMFLGNEHPDGWVIGVQLKNLTVQIIDKSRNVADEISLDGLTFPDAFQEFKTKMKNNGIDISELKTEQPYELPVDSLKDGKYFSIECVDSVNENIRYRHNAELIINELTTGFKDIEPVRIWPHHFDTGTFATIEKNKKGAATKTIGLGWAIPDSMVPEPYFYLSFWSEKTLQIENEPVKLPAEKWMMPTWNGAVLGVSEIIKEQSAEKQFLLVKEFYEVGINKLLEKLK